MACELLGARLTGPYFGSSIYVWASVLGVTLTALMSGYYLGGWLSGRARNTSLIFLILAAAGVLLAITPMTSQWVMRATLGMSVQAGATLSLLVFMFPPLLFMGMSSPVIIHLLNRSVDTSGKTAGSVYAISTLGGILSTFAMGFWLMPVFGLRLPALGFGAALVIPSTFMLLRARRLAPAAATLGVFTLAGLTIFSKPRTDSKDVHILEISEGIMGQIKVVDRQAGDRTSRMLLVNNVAQTSMNPADPDTSQSSYIFAYAAALSDFPTDSKALVLGLGGGALVRHFDRFGFDTDIVEIDPRVHDAAVKYFGLDPDRPVVIDDARHFLSLGGDIYDIIALDLFLSESPPADALSLEGLRLARSRLNPHGLLAINFPGTPDGPEGRLTRSFLRTLREAGFQVKALRTPEGGNFLVLASPEGRDFSRVDYFERGKPARRLRNLENLFVDLDAIDFSDAVILDDAHSRFETLHADVAIEWRRLTRALVQRDFVDNDLQMVR